MRTLGVDLASSANRTAICWVEWAVGRGIVTDIVRTASDDTLVESFSRADKVGIDVPFGWPQDFVRAISEYTNLGRWPVSVPHPTQRPKQLQFRATDRYVHQLTGRWPLSVSSDRIAIPAMRAAALFSRISSNGEPVARDGSGKVVEVYPAAALRIWGFSAQGYKRKENTETRCRLLKAIATTTAAWLTIGVDATHSCEASDDALDALIAALVARAAAIGQCEALPTEFLSLALVEGWIALPTVDSLPALV